MDDLTKTLSDLQNKAENCSKSDRLITLDFLKKLINNLENVEDETLDDLNVVQNEPVKCIVKKPESCKDSIHKTPLKLTIRKFKSVESNFICHDCHKTFVTMKKMISHVVNSHTKAEVTCRICKGTFYCYNLLIIHECICPKQTAFIHRQCGICSKLFVQKKEYHLHMKDEHMLTLDKFSKSFSCHVCQSSFQLRSQLLVHTSQFHTDTCATVAEPTVNKFLKMSQNSVRIDNDSAVNNISSSKPKPMIKSRNWCTVCKRNFLSQKALNKHFVSYMHKVNAGELKMFKKFVCDVCGNSFNKIICLQRHVSSHHNEFAHKCNLCDYRTSEKCNLTEHMRRHYQIRNFACEFCDARFIAKRELKDHVAFKHNSLRPFECSDCGKLFKTNRILRRHAKTHSEFRPYVCACGSSFLRMTNLRRHHLTVHHEASPVITKIQVADDATDSDQSKDYWYADSKFIKNKKTTPLTLNRTVVKEERLPLKESIEPVKLDQIVHSTAPSNLQILNVNYIMKVSADSDKDSKMYWSVNQNFLDDSDLQSTNQTLAQSPLNVIIGNKSSLQDSSVMDDSMNICDLVSSPSYPLLVSADQSRDNVIDGNNKLNYDLTLKQESISKYKVESIMMESENRYKLDGIWRPIDTVDEDQSMMDEHNSSMVSSNALDIFPQNPGLISSFNEVFLTSVSNNCYPDDVSQWNGISLSANPAGYNPDNSQYIYTDTVSSCEPLCDSMPVSDSNSGPVDNFLYYNQPTATLPHHHHHQHPQSFAYIESYSSNINMDHNYGGSVNDNFPSNFYHQQQQQHHQPQHQQQHINNQNSHMQDLFSMSYSSTANSDYNQIPVNNSSISNILFNQEQLFHNPSSSSSSSTNQLSHHQQQSSWLLHGQHSPINDYSSSDTLQPLMLDSYKISSQIALPSSSSSSSVSMANHPLRILSPIDFFVADNVFSSSSLSSSSAVAGIKHEYCLSLHDQVNMADTGLITDFCSQNHQFSHNSAQICSKNFSVVNLISTGACPATNGSKDQDDTDLLFSGPDDQSVI